MIGATVIGKYGIKATVLAYSISQLGKEFITWEIEYSRIILAELNTHRMLSKNSFSSRAVPWHKMIQQLNGRPVRFGANQAGMQDQGVDFDAKVIIPDYLHGALEHYLKTVLDDMLTLDDLKEISGDGTVTMTAFGAWDFHKMMSVGIAGAMNEAKYHKQTFNRLTEAHQMMKTVISGTETDNFFWLRDHDAADPTLAELARVMREAKEQSVPMKLKAGEWHLPYIDCAREDDDTLSYSILTECSSGWSSREYLSLEDAIKVSCARCAAVSYRNEGYGVEKSKEVYDRLVGDERKHASAFEHCGTPMQDNNEVLANNPWMPETWEPGVTHVDRQGRLWSGNLQGWIQYRKLIPGENYVGTQS